ncbi:ParB/RepB/Spo0J family partition protein [Brevibacillus laterosporus]|uniref:helix-turn-helix domain-containing protein n=1 Tax=Brevibacillus laterosporus TaxID=1465 RepID=UPI003D1DE60D
MHYEIKTVPVSSLRRGKFQVYANMSPERYASTRADIESGGVRELIHIDEDFVILDGHHRFIICGDLGIEFVEVKMYYGLTDDDKFALAYRQGFQGKEITRDEKIEIAIKLRKEGRSYPQIADWLGVSDETVRIWIKRNSTSNSLDVEKVEGYDGKVRPSQKLDNNELDSRRRRIKTLRDEGKPLKEIAQIEGVSVGTVHSDVKRIKREEQEAEAARKLIHKDQRVEEIEIEALEIEESAPVSVADEEPSGPNNAVIRARKHVFDATTAMVSTYRLVNEADNDVKRAYLGQVESFVEAALIMLDRYEQNSDKSALLSLCIEVFKKAKEPIKTEEE